MKKIIDIQTASSETKAVYQFGFEKGYQQSKKDNEAVDLMIGFFMGAIFVFVFTVIFFI